MGSDFVKEIDYNLHYFRVQNALGIDLDVANSLIKKNIKNVVLIDKKLRKKWTAPFHVMATKGFVFPDKRQYKYKDEFQPQMFLRLPLWKEETF